MCLYVDNISDKEKNKRMHGVFYTITNPFKVNPFYKWWDSIPDKDKITFLEPFAGANNIVSMILELFPDVNWMCFDISPPAENMCEEFEVYKRDTLLDFPKGYSVAITNPPYLARNSATRRGLEYPDTEFNDIYKYSLDVMLKNVDYVAAIIPESFLTQNIFHDRLQSVVSLTCKMFDDTECPVCLALFVPKGSGNFSIYRQDRYIGCYEELKNEIKVSEYSKINWKFNDKLGSIGFRGVDNLECASIKFCLGEDINEDSVRQTSRAITRISGLPEYINREDFINKCNELINDYRSKTKDVFLTSFKGLRKDNQYRRRMDFFTAKNILNKAMESFDSSNEEVL